MSALKSAVIYMVANVASAAVPLLLLPLLTRVLTPGDYGQVIAFSLLVTLCQCVTGLNVHAALGVIWFRQPRETLPDYTGAALTIALVSTLIVALLVFLVFSAWPDLMAGITPHWAALAAATAGANVILQSRLVLWQSQGKAMQSASLQFLTSVTNVALSLLAVLGLGWGGDGRNFGFASATVIMATVAILAFLKAGEIRWAPTRAKFRHLIGFGLPLVFHTFAGVLLSTADRWTISIKLDSASLGIYGAGAQLGMTMAILGDAFVKAFSPWLYAKLSEETPDSRHCAVGAIYAAMPMFFVMALGLWAALAIGSTLLLGPQYRLAADYLPWFMLGGAFNGVYLCTSVLFFHNAKTRLLATVSFLSGLGAAALTWLLISTFGVTGAATAYACGQGVLALATTVVAMQTFNLPWFQPRRALMTWFNEVEFLRRLLPATGGKS